MVNRFNIVFEKLREAGRENDQLEELTIEVGRVVDEAREIDELRRLVLETCEPATKLYTIG